MPNDWPKYALILLMLLAASPDVRAAETAAPATATAAAEPAAEAAPAGNAAVMKLGEVTGEQAEADREALSSQRRIDALDDETQKLLSEYRRAVADAESFHAYATQLGTQIQSQEEELADIQRQLDEIETTSRSIVPLERRMLETLREFVRLDLPFLLEERNTRVTTLLAMLDRAGVSISEKYRRIVEAYQVEMDYGRTIESYEGKLAADQGGSAERTARFLRIGRVSLMYQTLDGKETGYWDAAARSWRVDNHYAHAFKQGVAVAQKISAPEMLLTPVPAPAEAES